VLAEQVGDESWHLHRTPFVGLGRTDLEPPSHLRDGLHNVDRRPQQVEPFPFQGSALTGSEARERGDGGGGTEGSPIWTPSTNIMAGQPDQLLGHPVWSDPNVAAQGSNARIVAFADWNSYYVRTVGQVQIELDRSRYFDTDQTGVRAKLRADGGLIDTNGLVPLLMNV
jgi:hypothetical protein